MFQLFPVLAVETAVQHRSGLAQNEIVQRPQIHKGPKIYDLLK